MGSLTRKMRRNMTKKRSTVPFPKPESFERLPGKILLSIELEDATLNWQASVADIHESYNRVEMARRQSGASIGAAEVADDAFKSLARDIIIRGLKKNEHMDRKKAREFSSLAMWYMWLKQAAFLKSDRGEFTWDELRGITLLIVEAGKDYYQFQWGLHFKSDALPELPRIDVWKPYRAK